MVKSTVESKILTGPGHTHNEKYKLTLANSYPELINCLTTKRPITEVHPEAYIIISGAMTRIRVTEMGRLQPRERTNKKVSGPFKIRRIEIHKLIIKGLQKHEQIKRKICMPQLLINVCYYSCP